MIKRPSLLLSALFSLFAMQLHAADPLPKLSVTGNSLTNPQGEKVTLKGVSFCSLAWHSVPKTMQKLVDENPKANVVRLPVQPSVWKKLGAQTYLDVRLDPAIKACNDHGLYCVVDWHAIDDWDEEQTARDLTNFWQIVAPRYADNPNILYEFFNEPKSPHKRNAENWLKWRDTASQWVSLIRSHAPETVILVGSPHWSQMPNFAKDHPFEGTNLVYTMHLYPNWSQRHWDELFGDAAATIPLFISEWGWSSAPENSGHVYGGSQEKFAVPLKEYLKSRPEISWSAWSYDRLCAPAMLGKDDEMHRFVKHWLKEEPTTLTTD